MHKTHFQVKSEVVNSRKFTADTMKKSPSLVLIESDPSNIKRVQRLSMQFESKNSAPTSPVAQRKEPPATPRKMKKIASPSEPNTLIDELNSKLRARNAENMVSSNESKDNFFETELSPFPEVQPEVLVRSHLEQIKLFSEFSMLKDDERCHFHSLLNRLGNSIAVLEQTYKNRLMEMKAAQDSSFAQIFIDKNEELNKLRAEIENLNKLKKVHSPQLQSELSAAKDEVQRLDGIVKKQSGEINKLTYSLLEAQSYIESLEKTKNLPQTDESSELHPKMQQANEHFKTIKQALLANRNLLKAIQMKRASELN